MVASCDAMLARLVIKCEIEYASGEMEAGMEAAVHLVMPP